MTVLDNIINNLRSFFKMESDATEAEVDQRLTEEVEGQEQSPVNPKTAAIVEVAKVVQPKESDLTDDEQTIRDQEARITSLIGINNRLKLDIQQLETTPAADLTTGTAIAQEQSIDPSWMQHPMNKKLRRKV